MPKFRKTNVNKWTDDIHMQMPPSFKLLYDYLTTNSYTRQCGIHPIYFPTAAKQIGYGEAQLKELFEAFCKQYPGVIQYDCQTKEYILVSWIKENYNKSPQTAAFVAKEILDVKSYTLTALMQRLTPSSYDKIKAILLAHQKRVKLGVPKGCQEGHRSQVFESESVVIQHLKAITEEYNKKEEIEEYKEKEEKNITILSVDNISSINEETLPTQEPSRKLDKKDKELHKQQQQHVIDLFLKEVEKIDINSPYLISKNFHFKEAMWKKMVGRVHWDFLKADDSLKDLSSIRKTMILVWLANRHWINKKTSFKSPGMLRSQVTQYFQADYEHRYSDSELWWIVKTGILNGWQGLKYAHNALTRTGPRSKQWDIQEDREEIDNIPIPVGRG